MACSSLEEVAAVRMTHTRNVLVVGKTGSGKSTIANRILGGVDGEDAFALSDKEFGSVTPSTGSQRCTITTTSGSEYDIQVIDTVGFFDTRTEMPNTKVVEDIKKFFRKNVGDGIHLVLFVFKQGTWTEEQQKTMDIILKEFSRDEIREISALVFTGCENLEEESKQKLIDEFKRDKSKIADFMTKGVFAVGFPRKSKTKPALWEVYKESMSEDVKQLRNVIYNARMTKLAAEIQTDVFWNRSVFEKGWCAIL